MDYDFSIVHLKEPVKCGNTVIPACLPPTWMGGDYLGGKSMAVSGWGKLVEGGTQPKVLHKISIPGLSISECINIYGGLITDSMMCAGIQEGGTDACQNDSGGNQLNK